MTSRAVEPMSVLVALLTLAATGPGMAFARRLALARRVRGLRGWARPARAHIRAGRWPRALAAIGLVLVGWQAIGGLAGVGVGLALAWSARHVLARQRSPADRERARRLAADVPAAVDLLAACLAAGSGAADAADAVAAALGGPVGEALRLVTAELRLGGDPPRCWRRLGQEADLAALGRALARCADSGASLADGMSRFADDYRRRRRWTARERVRKVGVRASAPLGLCFLPAFVLIGVVPVVIGLADQVLRR